MSSGYVLAGFETLAGLLHNFILNREGEYQNNFTRSDISRFLSTTCAGFLHSYGQNFANVKKYGKYNYREATIFDKCRDFKLFDDCNFIVDSGGFQISVGRLTRRESDLLYKLYYEFLEEYSDRYDKAFILDIPPGPGCEIFHNFNDVYKLNLESYLKAKSLPEEVRKKIIYIHHFRTPELWKIYTKILRENDMFNSFNYHGTGGIVANMASDITIPCIIYVLPIIPLLNECIKFNKKVLNFHVLGGSNFRDIYFYELFRVHVMKQHGIELNITYDSSGLFKGLMVGRFIYVKENGIYYKLNLRSPLLNNRFKGGNLTIKDKLISTVNNFALQNNFKQLDINNIYDKLTGTFHRDISVYIMLYMLDQFNELQNNLKQKAEESYKLYENKNFAEFTDYSIDITKNLNEGKLTKKQRIKTYSLITSLNMLTDLDEDRCQYIIKKSLSGDEFTNLEQQTIIPL